MSVFKPKAEILAPAGSFESVVAACRCGADAVYLGAKEFSARASAQNFDLNELSDTVAYCHDRDVNVHLALNTALYDDELYAAANLIENAAKIGIDALIVSDLGVLSLAKEICPSLSLHASTQMSIGSLSGAKMAKNLGFDRAVLAREMNLSEISEVSKSGVIETEVFVHGALCECISGQCYLSAVLGGRSGNRGRCAQPCRLNFSVENSSKNYVLSLKDLSLFSHLDKLNEIGVNSFKIEGRMKRPEYVAAAVSLVKAGLSGEKDSDMLKLAKDIFSRSGFTDGYLRADISSQMFGIRQNEDALNTKQAIPKLHELYRRENQRVNIFGKFSAKLGKKISLTFFDEKGNRVACFGEEAQKAVSKAVSPSDVVEKISKLGSTPYFLKDLEIDMDDDLYISPSSLNSLKREAAEILSNKRSLPQNREIFKAQERVKTLKYNKNQKIYARFENINQLKKCYDFFDKAILPYRQLISALKEEKLSCLEKIVAELDRYAFSNDKNLENILNELKKYNVKSVCVQNIGQLEILNGYDFDIIYGPFMNIYNSRALDVLSEHSVKEAVVSFEVSSKKISQLDSDISVGALVYGYLPLMITRACPIKNVKDCSECKKKGGFLKDRTGRKMRVKCRGAVSEIYNSVPLVADISDKNFINTDFLLCYFSAESDDNCAKILKGIKAKEIPLPNDFTRGLYKSGVI